MSGNLSAYKLVENIPTRSLGIPTRKSFVLKIVSKASVNFSALLPQNRVYSVILLSSLFILRTTSC